VATKSKAERRTRLIRSAIEVIAEKGLGGTRVADIAERAGISPGHVLYYFDGKADIFMRALRTIEDDLRAEAEEAFSGLKSATARWDWLVDRAAPTGPGDARVLLWMEAWERAPRDPEVSALVVELERRWIDLLLEVIEYGRARGELAVDDAEDFAVRFSALMDGLMLQVVTGSPTVDRERMLAICAAAGTEIRR
jgi:AcrR family transcriptional regulator